MIEQNKDRQTGITQDQLERDFDGTIFNGFHAVRVVFDNEGEVEMVDSYHIASGEPRVPFVRRSTGGWKGEFGFYGDSTVTGKQLDTIIQRTRTEWEDWKAEQGDTPTVDFRTWKSQNKQS